MDPKKILVAVDASENALRAVAYVADLLGALPGFMVDLLNIERVPDRDLFRDEEQWKEACVGYRREANEIMARAQTLLLGKGFPAASLGLRFLPHCKSPLLEASSEQCTLGASIAQQILDICQAEGYGTVVVGRRGVSKAEEFLFGSVSSRVVHNARGCAVWVVS